MGGLTLILIGMTVMLVAPIQRLTAYRREHPGIATPLRTAYPPPDDPGFAEDLLDTIG
ncbi:hypothetical protein [Sphingomonas sp. MMS24-J13]|uniref:hypothetical protein n=1 Tax=Sphingomonas sp. MMS24-J13 TaxID=3238686 RepID=UPI0038512D6F